MSELWIWNGTSFKIVSHTVTTHWWKFKMDFFLSTHTFETKKNSRQFYWEALAINLASEPNPTWKRSGILELKRRLYEFSEHRIHINWNISSFTVTLSSPELFSAVRLIKNSPGRWSTRPTWSIWWRDFEVRTRFWNRPGRPGQGGGNSDILVSRG